MSGKVTKTVMQRFINFVNSDWQWTGTKNKAGYGKILYNGRMDYAHRVSFELFNGPIPDNMQVLHACDDPGCVDPDHLHLGDQKTNIHEMMDRGRYHHIVFKGQDHGRAKFSNEQIREIRERVKNGCSYTELSREYHVVVTTISNIITGKSWKHLS